MSESQFFCILPWVHLSLYQDGNVKPCCRAGNDSILGNLATQSLEELWHSPKMNSLRKAMINNEASEMCRRCYEEEALGKKSFRLEENHRLSHLMLLLDKARQDGTLPTFKLRSMGVRFSNVCNFSCRTCRPNASTSWYFDAKILSGNKTNYKKALRPTETFSELLAQIIPHKDSMEEFYFAGGEPLMAQWHDQLLDWFIENNVTNLKISYSTNFSFVHKKNFHILESWKHFREIELLVSVDGTEKRGEYIRKGLDWKSFKSELELFLEKIRDLPHIKLNISCTVSVFNIFNFTDVIRMFLYDYSLNGYLIRIDGVTEPEIYDPKLLPSMIKARASLNMQILIKELKTSTIEANERIIAQIEAVEKQMFQNPTSLQYNDFLKTTLRLDEIRSESFQQTFPELVNYQK